jgi:mono/diheme cytochrome c family protein
MKRPILVFALAALAGCTAYLPVPDALMADGDDARLSDLRAGRDLYINKCSGCHALKSVDLYDDATWTSEVQEMAAKKKVRLTNTDRDLLLRYLTTANGR